MLSERCVRGEACRANLLSRAASERLGGVCAAAMSGVGHDPAAHFERHRRTQREERERRARDDNGYLT